MNSGDHTTCTSTAGSPTHAEPQSTRPHNLPSRTRQFPSMSPCTQTGGPSYGGAASASSHTAVAAVASISALARSIDDARRLVVLVQRAGAVRSRRRTVGRCLLEVADDVGEVARKRDADRRPDRAQHLRRLSIGARPIGTGSRQRAHRRRRARVSRPGGTARGAATRSLPVRSVPRPSGCAEGGQRGRRPIARWRCRCPTVRRWRSGRSANCGICAASRRRTSASSTSTSSSCIRNGTTVSIAALNSVSARILQRRLLRSLLPVANH